MAQCFRAECCSNRRAGTKTLSILTQSMRKKKMSYENVMKTRYRAKPYDIFNGSKRTTIEANIHVWKLRKLKEIRQYLNRGGSPKGCRVAGCPKISQKIATIIIIIINDEMMK